MWSLDSATPPITPPTQWLAACLDRNFLRLLLELAEEVEGYTTGTTEGPIQSWKKMPPASQGPVPVYYPWVVNPDKVKRKKGS